jgi:dethiobiotin synthetase
VNERFIVTGIGTGIGKTLVSSIFVEALEGDYWKPIQAGSLDATDSEQVRALVRGPETRIHPECYRLTEAISPHAAARRQGIQINIANMIPPESSRPLVIEGAGGVMVPLNDDQLMVDFFAHLRTPMVLVSQHYLGSINHTLLSAEALRLRKLPVLGIVFNGNPNPESEDVILKHTGLPMLLRIQPEKRWTSETTRKYAELLRSTIKKHELV